MRQSLPAVFVSHGAPTLAIEPGPTHAFLKQLGEDLGTPRAVVCVSAHWEASAPTVSGAEQPATIHDFFGFPQRLYELHYPAPGDPALAGRIADLLGHAGLSVAVDTVRGLDHGAWVPLVLMFPSAGVPVVQLSVQTRLGPRHHLELGRALRPLREDGVLLLGSGSATHNLREYWGQAADAPAPAYVRDFEAWLCAAVEAGDETALVGYRDGAPSAARNHPTAEHFLPLLVAAGAGSSPRGRVLHRTIEHAVLSMAAFAWD